MPRKTLTRQAAAGQIGPAASMRPRPDATENPPRPGCRFRARRASMRPRPDATENFAVRGRAAGPRTLQ